jgi:UPF0755 protein
MDAFSRFWSAFVSALNFNWIRLWRLYVLVLVCLVALIWIGYSQLLAAPEAFPSGQDIVIEKGAALPAIAAELANEEVIKQPLLFEAVMRAIGGAGRIQAGPYQFATPANLITVVDHLLTGNSGIPEIHITFIEGSSVRIMALLVAQKFPDISASDFVTAAGPYEGYLFPDTYDFSPSATPDQIVQTMNANFYAKIAPLQSEIASSTHSLSDIIIMASIVEKEANTPQDRRIVAGILWSRIAKGIPLQVDAPFGYLQGRNEYSPSLADLSIDSPYNTYEHKGLPPGPIGSPGLDSIEAAINPTKTNYLFYLTGSDGQMYYAATYAGQLANERKYLN